MNNLHFCFWESEIDSVQSNEKYKKCQCQTQDFLFQFKKFNFLFISYTTDSICNQGKCLSSISIFTTTLSFHLQLMFVLHVINQKNRFKKLLQQMFSWHTITLVSFIFIIKKDYKCEICAFGFLPDSNRVNIFTVVVFHLFF